MNDSYERSYYEIALTNNQVLSALAVLLLCLLGSFVAGMWVAREAGSPEDLGTLVAVTTEPESTDESAGSEFQFFRRAGSDGDSASAAQEGAGSTQAPTIANQAKEPAVEPIARTVTPVEIATAGEPEAEAPQPFRQAVTPALVEREPSALVETERKTTPEPSQQATDPFPVGQELVIQVLSSSDQEQAGKTADQLRGSGYRAFLSSALVEGRTMYRVRVGPYSDQTQAEDAAQKIKRQFRLNTWITPRS